MFDLVHCDTWGPYDITSHVGYKYFITTVDDHSLYTWVFLMKRKSDTLKIIPNFFTYVQTQYETTIKTFIFDNASEPYFKEFFFPNE